MKKFSSILFSSFVIFGILLYFIDFMALDISYYNNFHKENNISVVSGLPESWVRGASDSLVKFLKNGEDTELEEHFNEKEISHMRDVYKLFEVDRIVYKGLFSISLICFVYYILKKDKSFFKSLKKYFLAVYILMVSFFGLCSLFFSSSFIYFHKLFFRNDLWLLNYETDYMIRILPEEFFFNLFINVIVLWTLVVLVLYTFIKIKKVDSIK